MSSAKRLFDPKVIATQMVRLLSFQLSLSNLAASFANEETLVHSLGVHGRRIWDPNWQMPIPFQRFNLHRANRQTVSKNIPSASWQHLELNHEKTDTQTLRITKRIEQNAYGWSRIDEVNFLFKCAPYCSSDFTVQPHKSCHFNTRVSTHQNKMGFSL